MLAEVFAVHAGVVEDAVQNNSYVKFLCFGTKNSEIFLGSQQRVYFEIVRGVVPVVGARRKYRVQIDDADAQRRQIRQLFGDALKVAAPEVPFLYGVVFVADVVGRSVPVLHAPSLVGSLAGAAEPVGEDGVGYAPRVPFRHAVWLVDADLVGHRRFSVAVDLSFAAHGSRLVAVAHRHTVVVDDEEIPEQAVLLRSLDLPAENAVVVRLAGDHLFGEAVAAQDKIHGV